MNEPELDTALLRKAVEWVLEQDRLHGPEWDQQTWGMGRVASYRQARPVVRAGIRYRPLVDCGTSCCVAGKICLLAGDTLAYEQELGETVRADDVVEVGHVLTPEGRVVEVVNRAAELLGVDDREVWPMFAGNRSPQGVLRLARELAEAHGEELGL